MSPKSTMHRRLSTAEKGKAIAMQHHPAPRAGRVRLEVPETPVNLQKHSLTLIGRVTNPSVQKVWALIPFFTDHWKADIPPIGSDLGMGMFQFQFELESDLLTVLEKRPYHYARWMIILQRWEPTISPSFPSMIPFWIKIQGIPIHLWSEALARSIGEDLGTFEVADITAQTMRARVHVNGRLPLLKSSVVEYSNGDEVTATLVYEKLERHCLKCGRLDHEIRDCLEAKHEKKAQLAAQETSIKSRASVTNLERPHRDADLPSGGPIRRSPKRDRRLSAYSRIDYNQRHTHGRELPNYRSNTSSHHQLKEKQRFSDTSRIRDRDRDDFHQYQRKSYENDRYRRSSPPHRERITISGDSHSANSPKPTLRKVGRERSPLQDHINPRHVRDDVNSRGDPCIHEVTEPALGGVRDAIVQLSEQGQREDVAPRRMREKPSHQTQGRITSPRSTSQRRIPLANRLGPTNDETGTPISPIPTSADRVPIANRLGLPPRPEVGSSSRIPIMDRLGPLLDEATDTEKEQREEENLKQKKRKPGRPPGKNKVNASPLSLPGASSKLRKVRAKPAVCRSHAEEALTSAIKLAREWTINSKPDSTAPKNRAIPTPRCDAGTLTVRSDAAWNSNSNVAGIGWVILSSPNHQEFHDRLEWVPSPLLAEGLALREAVHSCLRSGATTVRGESDSAQLIRCLNSGEVVPELHSVVSDILCFASYFHSCSFVWIPRENNSIADGLAKMALNFVDIMVEDAFIAPN
ncbi:hypothetical protein Bca4012_086180 [Brassica carinata]